MHKIQFTTRHQELLKLKDKIEVLRLGQKNKDYINLIERLNAQVTEELRTEQARIGLIPKTHQREFGNESG